jgi:hypothetical protein
MRNRMFAALLCGGVFLLAGMSSALAINNPIPGVDVIVKKDPGGATIMTVQTDGNGAVVLKGLAPGDYVIEIDGPSLVKAMDRLAPATPEKKSGSSFSIGVGGSLFGGGSHRDTKGGQGAGPVQGGHGGSHSGGIGLTADIPVGDGQTVEPHAIIGVLIAILLPAVQKHPHEHADSTGDLGGYRPGTIDSLAVPVSVETPYCRDGAVQGMRIRVTVPTSIGPMSVTKLRMTWYSPHDD